ncbi:MAG TPA: flagellar export protein FliJ [Firmicutes bacterium]|nr:flagellar export protein FliJ [Bacillota bacterium]
MRRFKFRLERVLRLREQEEEVEKQQLVLLFRQLQAAMEYAASCRRALNELERRFSETLRGEGRELSLGELVVFRARQEQLRREYRRAEGEVASWRERVAAQRERLLEAAKRREVLRRLRSRALEEYRMEWNREEQRVLDEVASVWHFRQQGLG